MAILSASGYGNSKKMQESDIKSTAGNKSGVYVPLAWEFTAGGLEERIFSGVDGRYYDEYTSSYTSAKVGDGLGKTGTSVPGCAKWQGADDGSWVASSDPYFRRGDSALFSFYYGFPSHTYLGRAAVVCGAGF